MEAVVVSAEEFASWTLEQKLDAYWSSGNLRPLMHDGQKRLRDDIHRWRVIDQLAIDHEDGALPLVYGIEGGKRFGKTTGCLWIAAELAVLFPGCSIRYTSAYQKTIDEIVGTVQALVFETAPESCRPVYHGKRGPRPAGFYFPAYGPMQGARIALAGMDDNPDALRGQGNDFDFISECAFIRNLEYTLRNVLIHQYHGRHHARLIAESSAPKTLETDWERHILPDCKRRNACFSATIMDNPRLSEREKQFWIAQAGGLEHPDCQREYFNVIAADPQSSVVPEFSEALHVHASERPNYAIGMAAMDPGMRDLFAVLWGYWDAARAKLVVERDWAERNVSTSKVAEAIRGIERELYTGAAQLIGGIDDKPKRGYGLNKPDGFCWWDGKEFRANPMQRVSDTDARLIGDLTVDYGISVMNTLKDDKEAALFAFRNAFLNGKIEVHPRCAKFISHVKSARWNDKRTDYERTERHGHYDLLDCGVYLWRMIQPVRAQISAPPDHIDRNDRSVLIMRPGVQQSHMVKKLSDGLGGRRRSWR